MGMNLTLKKEFDATGRIWFRNAISPEDLLAFDQVAKHPARAGARVKASPTLHEVLRADGSLMQSITALDPKTKPVRVVAFNKSQQTNWGVPWHQDRVIAVADKQDVDGFANWTKKSDVWHCEPPLAILENMLFVRIHLDDTDDQNGAMQIAAGSHAEQFVAAKDAEEVALRYPIETCTAKRGDVLVLHMLTLHGSKPSTAESDRRVFRVDFAATPLPAPMKWAAP